MSTFTLVVVVAVVVIGIVGIVAAMLLKKNKTKTAHAFRT
jgi:hypothetical protein